MMTDDEKQRMHMAVNAAVGRAQSLRQQFADNITGSSDSKRPKAWQEYGFPDTVTADMLERMWRRGGIAFGAVGKLIGNCWKSAPQIVEGGAENSSKKESKFEGEFSKIAKGLRLWKAFKKADEMRLVRRWSALIIYYADNKEWGEPVERGAKRIAKIRPVWSSALTPGPLNEKTGEPTYWQYKETNTNGEQLRMVNIHPDRLFILGDSAVDAIGWLEPAYNDLISLEKLCGGGGESFLKNAARQLAVTFDKDIDLENIAAMYGVKLPELKAQFQQVAKDLNRGNDTLFALQGGNVAPITSAVPDPGPVYNTNLQNVAAAIDIPTKILVGQQTGERASTEDREYFNMRCQSRRVSELSDEIYDFVAKIAAAGAINVPSEITIAWDDLNESSQGDKLENAAKMAEINSKAIDPQAEPFTIGEIRVAAGFEPEKVQDGEQ